MYCYIHIPFCASKCQYCRFASYAGLDSLKVNFYVDFLCREIEGSDIKRQKLKTIYFGGGTPTTLNIQQLEKIIKTLERKYGFEEDIEINLETTPENVCGENLEAWKKIGINRLSMGIQSLNDRTLKEISRKPKKEIFRALEALNLGVIENVSVDFIIGLPFVGKGELVTYMKQVLENYDIIQHVSVYMLEDYYEAPEEVDSRFQNIVYPVNWSKDGLGEEQFLEEYLEIKEYLKSEGYTSYEISNFSKNGYECRHNKAYWDHSEVFAFGLGASGYITGKRYKNSDDFGEYYKGENIEYDTLSDKDILLEKIMFGLRTQGFCTVFLPLLNQDSYNLLIRKGLLRKSSDTIQLTSKSYTLLDSIILQLFD